MAAGSSAGNTKQASEQLMNMISLGRTDKRQDSRLETEVNKLTRIYCNGQLHDIDYETMSTTLSHNQDQVIDHKGIVGSIGTSEA